MGMGEPLANIERLLPALDEAGRPHGLGISARRITISTVGLPPAIDGWPNWACHYHLAVSLHAPNDALRNRLVPVNDKIGLADILAAADDTFESSGRRLTFEYVLLGGMNDEPQHARQLAGSAARADGAVERDSLQPRGRAALSNAQRPTTRSGFWNILRSRPDQRAGPPAQRGQDRRRLWPVAAYRTRLNCKIMNTE